MIYRNKKLLALAKEAPHCFRCGEYNMGQVVACHANSHLMGKATGIKAADLPAYMCQQCHDMIDGRTGDLSRDEKWLYWCEAAILSMHWALENHPDVLNTTK